MFVISLKSDKLKKFTACLLAAALLVIGGTVAVMSSKTATVGSFTDVSLKADSHEARKAFFAAFGWEISDEPLEVKETVIPAEFDKSYNEYNELQKEQNFDLEKYKNVRVKSWSYEILNYPGYENSDGVIRGNLLTCNGKIIGGDVCSVELVGFMHGFSKEDTADFKSESSSLPQEE